MGLSNRLWFRVVNDLLHDVAAGVSPGAVLALWLVRAGAKEALPSEMFATTMRTWSWILLILFAALVVSVVTGSVRLNYRTLGVSPDALEAKGRAALAKHAVFAVVFVASAVAAFSILQP
jgi:putative copper export protein